MSSASSFPCTARCLGTNEKRWPPGYTVYPFLQHWAAKRWNFIDMGSLRRPLAFGTGSKSKPSLVSTLFQIATLCITTQPSVGAIFTAAVRFNDISSTQHQFPSLLVCTYGYPTYSMTGFHVTVSRECRYMNAHIC